MSVTTHPKRSTGKASWPQLETARRDPRNSKADACVAFDFSAKRPFTKFYVFNDKGILSPSANLDGHIGHPVKETGNKYVPGLCKTCHGADKVRTRDKFTVNDPPDGDIGAHFLPFDLDNFDYLDDSRVTRRAQEGKFKRLNDMIRAIEPTTSVIGELIDGWYKGGRIEQDSEFIPPEWMENEQLYRRVVKPSCRTCHVALTPNFATLEVFKVFAKSIHDHVCADAQVPFPRSMPNSKVTFDQFWLSRVQGTVLVRFLRDELEKPSMPSITCPPPPPP